MKTKRNKKGRAKKAVLIVAIVLVVVFCGLSLVGGNIMFNFALNPDSEFAMSDLPQDAAPEVPGELPPETMLWNEYYAEAAKWFAEDGKKVAIEAEDGSRRVAWEFSNDSHLYAIVFHGYYGNSFQMSGYARMFHDMGMNVLVPDALAHGESDGQYIGMGWLERSDVLGWIGRIVNSDPEAQIVLFGVSMGGATVMMAAGEELPANVKCIVEDCGYSSVLDEFSVQLEQLFGLPDFPLLYSADLICRIRAGYGFAEASSVKQLKKAEVPMLFIHGEEDTFVPYEMLDKVYEACASPFKERLSIPGAAHGAAAGTDPVTYWTTIETFMSRFMDLEVE